jgi:Trk K+ transport system NAD-binding subunit
MKPSLRHRWLENWLLIRQFQRPLLLFSLGILLAGWLYYRMAIWLGEPLTDLPEAFYLVLTLSFLQPSGEFPTHWQLDLFYFLMPLFGIALLAQGISDFGIMLFNKRMRNKEWQMALASTFQNHIVLVGLGHLGFRVTRELHELGRRVVVIELDPQAELHPAVNEWGVPVLQGDATQTAILQAANITKAESIVLCTQNDTVNLQAALKARTLNPAIQVVIRIFDDEFAAALQNQFGFQALSATGISAPIFAASAANASITRPLMLEDTALSLATFSIEEQSALQGLTVGEVEQTYDVSVVRLKSATMVDMHPPGERKLAAHDQIVVLGEPGKLKHLIHAN